MRRRCYSLVGEGQELVNCAASFISCFDSPMSYKNISVALAGTEDETVVIQEAVRLREALGATLSVVHVNDPSAGKMSMMMPAQPLTTEEDLRQQCRDAGFPELADTVEIRLQVGASYAQAIADLTQDAELLVMGHHRQNPIIAAFKDSTDEDVLNLVSCPVVVVRLD